MPISEPLWGADGLVPVVVQDAQSGEVLTLAYADREALARTRAEGRSWFYSRSRKRLWRKGETSGNEQEVVEIALDCDGDALRYRVVPHGPACHTGARSCFAPLQAEASPTTSLGAAIRQLRTIIAARGAALPEGSYTASLLRGGIDRIGKKIGEEATEVVIAAKNGEPQALAGEAADLVYHLLVLLQACGLDPDEVGKELARRQA